MEFLRGKPRSVISVTSDASYDNIMYAVRHDVLDDKNLRATVSLCRANPKKVVCIVYRAYENSVLVLLGSKPTCIRMEGSKLQTIMSGHGNANKIYLFTYVKD